MSFDALILPPAPQPPAAGTGNAAGTRPAAFELDRAAPLANQDRPFLATLNRACERKSCTPARSSEGESQSDRSAEAPLAAAHPKDNRWGTNQKPLEDQPVDSEACASAADMPVVCQQPSWELIHKMLVNMTFAGDGAVAIEGQSDLNGAPVPTLVNLLIGQVHPEGHTQLAGLVGIGPFEQLQADISAQASNLHFFKQLAIQALNDQLVADPAARPLDNPFFNFWRALAAAPTEGADPSGRGDAFATRVDDLIHHLLQRYENRTAALGLEGAPSEAGGQKAAVTMAAVTANEQLLLQKMVEAKQPAEIQAAMAGKDGQEPAGSAKNIIADALLETRIDKNGEDAPAGRMQPASKAAEAAVNPNLAGQNVAARPAEETVHLKTSVVQNDLLAADQTGNKVIQIDGESKDSGFLASQENMPEHLAKLDNGNRSTAGTQRGLATQTMNQIVQKAVFLNNHSQNTVQIDLKPEFLGHIRMHIMTESQQVAVRIVAELPFVKEMLENNLNQLKTELQAQGLQVDELEVSVANDNRAEDDRYQRAAEMRRARALQNRHALAEEADAEAQKIGPGTRRDGMAQTAVDYFA